ADRRGGHRRSPIAAKIAPARLAGLAALVCVLLAASPTSAQVAGSVTLSSDLRFRGRSISDGEPAVSADLGYDHRSGIYVAASAATALSGEGPELVNVQENIGFAHRLRAGPTIDLGILHSDYPDYYGSDYHGPDYCRPNPYDDARKSAHFTEIYAGIQ